MPQEPKKRHSRQRQGKRRSSIKLSAVKPIACANCQKPTLPHIICKSCGFYNGREVLSFAKKQTSDEKSS